MFTLYQIVKRSIAETVPDKVFVHTRNATFGTISAPEQDYLAPFSKDVIPAMQRSSYSVHTVPDQFLPHCVSLSDTV